MRVLDLFSGRGGWTVPFRAAGHEVLTLDIDPRFEADFQMDIREFSMDMLPWVPDVVFASPPCECFSVASIGTHWTGGKRAYVPRTPESLRAKIYVASLVGHIEEMRSAGLRRWWIENPRGVLRNLQIIPDHYRRRTVWWCHYGENRAKPTDLWGAWGTWVPEPECHNRRPGHDDACCCHDHEAAPRGAKTGTQGVMGSDLRAEIPWGLAESIRQALESEMADLIL